MKTDLTIVFTSTLGSVVDKNDVECWLSDKSGNKVNKINKSENKRVSLQTLRQVCIKQIVYHTQSGTFMKTYNLFKEATGKTYLARFIAVTHC